MRLLRTLVSGPRPLLRAPSRSVMWFSESDPKGGYRKELTEEDKKEIRRGAWRSIPREYRRLRNWWSERQQATFEAENQAFKMFEDFSRTPDDVRPEWVVTVDADNGEGSSSASFTRTPVGTAVFSGELKTDVVKDTGNVRSGYANVRSPGNLVLGFNLGYDISHYNNVVIRYRGDGRNYGLILHSPGFFDIEWHDQHYYYLFTRGGPYWQTAKIPYSKFIFTALGRMQDKQYNVSGTMKFMSISLHDSKPGPFKLEVAYIGLYNEAYKFEKNAYEMYETTSTSKAYR